MLNNALEVLGTSDHFYENKLLDGVFQDSAVENVRLPAKLKLIEYGAFLGCKNLRQIRFPNRL